MDPITHTRIMSIEILIQYLSIMWLLFCFLFILNIFKKYYTEKKEIESNRADGYNEQSNKVYNERLNILKQYYILSYQKSDFEK